MCQHLLVPKRKSTHYKIHIEKLSYKKYFVVTIYTTLPDDRKGYILTSTMTETAFAARVLLLLKRLESKSIRCVYVTILHSQ